MNGRLVVGVVLVLVLILGMIGIGAYVYNAGVAQGLAESGKLAAPGTAPYPYYGPVFFHWPLGFGFLELLFLLFFFFLIFGLLRALFWRRGWGRGGPGGHWGKDVPPMFEEWHRRAHEPQSTEK